MSRHLRATHSNNINAPKASKTQLGRLRTTRRRALVVLSGPGCRGRVNKATNPTMAPATRTIIASSHPTE